MSDQTQTNKQTPQKMKTKKNTTAAANANTPDEMNPAYLFTGTWTDLLVKIANGEVDAKQAAIETLRGRGLDAKGNRLPRTAEQQQRENFRQHLRRTGSWAMSYSWTNKTR